MVGYKVNFTFTLYTFKMFAPEVFFNPLNANLNPIYHLLALLGVHHILHVSRIRVNFCEIRVSVILPVVSTLREWFRPLEVFLC